MIDTTKIEAMVGPSLDAMGYRVVRVALTGGKRPTLQIMAERHDDRAMTVDDCEAISHTVSALLDVADPIPDAYMLEISSPGIDRPLVRREDYERFAGFEAKVDLARPLDGRKRFRGRLLGVEGEAVKLLQGDAPVLLPLVDVARAKLVLTDELIAATDPQHRT